MAINVEIKSKPNENPASLIRRFSRASGQANVVKRVKGNAYKARPESDFAKKKNKMRKLTKQVEYKRLYKLGKDVGTTRRRR